MAIYRKLLLGAVAAALVVGGGAAAWAGNAGGPGEAATGHQPANPHPKVVRPLAAIDTSTESKYTPITQCRVVDTRSSFGGKVKAGTVRSWHVSGTTGFPSQGGTNGGCGVPKSATAVTAVIQSISATGAGDLHLWPFGSTEPQKIFMNYTNLYNVSESATFQINPAGTNDISVRAEHQSTHLVIDVTGYFVKPMYAFVNSDASLIHSSRVTGTIHLGTGTYEVDFDRDVSACAYDATPFTSGLTILVEPRSGNADGVFIFTETSGGTSVNAPFYLTVTC